MKLTIEKTKLAQALSAVSAVTSSRNSQPITTFASLECHATAQLIYITGTDLDCFYRRAVGAKIEKPGACLLPVARVKEWLGIVGIGNVTLELIENHIKLSMEGSGAIRLSAMPADQFPKPAKEEQKTIVEADFAPIKHIAPAIMEANKSAPNLEAIFIEPEGDGIICASTNGRQVGTVRIKAKKEGGWEGIVLPSKYASLVAGLGECLLSEAKNSLHFTNPAFHLIVRKSEHGIPNWRKAVVNEQFPVVGSITVMRDELAQAVAQCHVLRGNELGSEWGVRVSFGKTEGGMQVSCFVEKSADTYSHMVEGRIRGEFPPISLSTEYLTPFFALPDESPLKIEFTTSKTMVHMNAPDLGVDYYLAPLVNKAAS